MNELEVFKNEEFGEIRTLVINEEPWFIGKDIATALGYKDTSDALKRHVDNEDRLTRKFTYSGQNREMYIINESGLYSLVLSSKLPLAKKFKKWITSEVIPTIRKTGGYVNNDDIFINTYLPFADENTKQLFRATLTTVRKQNEIIESQKLEIATQNQQIKEMQPKVSYYDIVLQCKDLLAINVIAKDYGWAAIKMNKFLHEQHIQYKQGDTWLLYQEYAEMGYTSTKTNKYEGKNGYNHVKVHTYWTQKGRLFIYELMKKNGILPIIERENI